MTQTCVCCGSAVHSIEIKDDFLNNPLDQCSNCSHIQLHQIPTPAEIQKYYDGAYSDQRSNQYWDRYQLTMKKRAKAQSDFIGKHTDLKDLNVVDNGCGYGFLMKELASRNAKVKGLEFDYRCVEYCQEQGLEVEKMNAESALEDIQSTDLITMSHVLEHLTSIERSLDILRQKSKMLFIEVPYYDLKLPDQWDNQLGHINFFNEESLRLILERHGFRIGEILRCGPNMNFHWKKNLQYPKRKIETLLFFREFDTFWGMYDKPNPKGIWLRAFAFSE